MEALHSPYEVERIYRRILLSNFQRVAYTPWWRTWSTVLTVVLFTFGVIVLGAHVVPWWLR